MLTKMTLAFLLSALLCLSPLALAQGNRGGGRGAGSPNGRMYDPRTVETTSGEITNVEQRSAGGARRGVHLMLKTDKGENLAVHLGPAWYIDKQKPTLGLGDKVQVRGSRITFEDKPALIAAEVTKNGETLHLRDANGVPAWSGWRRGGW